ncbi:MAG: hypothetical protein HOO93_06345 [Methyloglobulus sp.]|nr:hypothetical protein [Methyloglobulus sp.]
MWSSVNIKLLVLAVVYRGHPRLLATAQQAGQLSDSRERRNPVQRCPLGKNRIKGLLADRECIGDEWVGWLNQTANTLFYSDLQQQHEYE